MSTSQRADAKDTVSSVEQQLLEAAARGDADEIGRLVELEADVDYQDEEGVSPLMKAAEGGHMAALQALLQAGAPWNAQDKNGYCAGDYAMGCGQQDAVDLLLDFAVQAELVLGALHRRMQVGAPSSSSSAAPNSDYLSQKLVYRGEQLLDADGEAVMMGWERPLMLRHAELICPGAQSAQQAQQDPQAGQSQQDGAAAGPRTADGQDALAGEDQARAPGSGEAGEGQGPHSQGRSGPQGQQQERDGQCGGGSRPQGRGGGHVLNVGFGLGIIDTAIQSHRPERHTIVEAHPDVCAHMVETGWMQRPGVRVLRGRWQDVLQELLEGGPYDGIFFDTYGEYYEEMREFHAQLPRLLAPDGVYSFFNGLASDNIFFHMVYCRLISLELAAKGLTVEYEPLAVGELGDDVWQGVRSKYWHFETYFLPRVTFEQTPVEGEAGGEEGEVEDGQATGA